MWVASLSGSSKESIKASAKDWSSLAKRPRSHARTMWKSVSECQSARRARVCSFPVQVPMAPFSRQVSITSHTLSFWRLMESKGNRRWWSKCTKPSSDSGHFASDARMAGSSQLSGCLPWAATKTATRWRAAPVELDLISSINWEIQVSSSPLVTFPTRR